MIWESGPPRERSGDQHWPCGRRHSMSKFTCGCGHRVLVWSGERRRLSACACHPGHPPHPAARLSRARPHVCRHRDPHPARRVLPGPQLCASGLRHRGSHHCRAVSGPWRGRLLDRIGLRRTVGPSIVVQVVCWSIAPWVGYAPLIGLAALAGLFVVPTFSILRQVILRSTRLAQRRTALSLDSAATELSFMAGPALGVWLATSWDTGLGIVRLRDGLRGGRIRDLARQPAADLGPGRTVVGRGGRRARPGR